MTLTAILGQAWRMTRRDWRAGELRFLLLALVVAVAALTSVGFFVERMRDALVRDASQLLGADMLLSSDQPITPDWITQAQQQGLSVAHTTVFPSMAFTGDEDDARSLLASVKGVSDGYPLRGSLRVTDALGQPDQVATGVPPAGAAWIDAQLLAALQLQPGDHLTLGDSTLRIDKIITIEPDRGSGFVSFAPRIMVSLDTLPATGLLQYGARVTYRLLVAGEKGAVQRYTAWAQSRIASDNIKGMRLETLDNARPQMQATLVRAEQFLSLVSLLAAMLAAVAVAMAARRFMLRHVNAYAMLRCLGMRQNELTKLYLAEFLFIGIAGSVLGAVVGFAAHFALLEALSRFVQGEIPPSTVWPGVQGVATGLLLLVGFALPPVLQLRDVPPNRVIRGESAPPRTSAVMAYLLGAGVFLALLLWQAGDVKVALTTAVGFIGGFGIFALVVWLLLRALRKMRTTVRSQAWRFAIAGLHRRPRATVMQVVALGLGLMALLLLTVIRTDLIGAWMQATPADAPNRFLINVQPEQKDHVVAHLAQAGAQRMIINPMIRGRLTSINGTVLTRDSYEDDRARRMIDREFNLSTMANLPPKNVVTQGQWFDDSKPEASVETGLARTLGLKLGDVMRFDIAGQEIDVTVTSLRELEWGSLQANFFVIINPAAMANMPMTWMSTFHLPAETSGNVDHGLIAAFPNLTVVDVSSVLRQVQGVMTQVIAAVEFLFLFTLAAGCLVLYAALAGSQEERMREAGLLRALGATRGQLVSAQRIEFLLTGAIAGVLASAGAALVGWALAHFVFKFEWMFSVWVWIAGIGIGMACAAIGGWLGLRHVLSRPPLQVLRES